MSQQKTGLVPGILVGLLAMLVGAAAYGAIIGITEYEIGFAAIGVGALIGLGMMAVKPSSPVLPPLAALFGLVGAALGQVIGGSVLLVKFAKNDGIELGYIDAFSAFTSEFGDIVGKDPKSLLFWAIGAFAAYSFVNKRVRAAREAESHAPGAPSQPPTPGAAQPQAEGNLFTPKTPGQ